MQITQITKNIDGLTIKKKNDDIEISSIENDSRRCSKNSLFVAVNGHKKDGHQFIDQALKAGAVALLVSDDYEISDKLKDSEVAIIKTKNVDISAAQIAHNFYGEHPANIATVTGTNGKSSVVHFCRQIWNLLDKKAASIGTLGVYADGDNKHDTNDNLTTPDSISLNKTLAQLAENKVEYAAIEASSHGLDQNRLYGISSNVVAFTNITSDHLDYHETKEKYRQAKEKIFDLVPQNGVAVLNADISEFGDLSKICADKKIDILSYGRSKEADICIIDEKISDDGNQDVSFKIKSKKYKFSSQLIGDFQIENLACAVAIAIAMGEKAKDVMDICANIEAVKGRMERVAVKPNGAAVIIDYAHTPDALEKVLKTLRKNTENQLVVLFGCGGNRDKEKRPQMGKIACDLADKVIITDDNPRSERSENIRSAIIEGCNDSKKVSETQNRRTAITNAVEELNEGDILVVAGKGHEQYQIVGRRRYYFDDAQVARDSVDSILWQSANVDKILDVESSADWWATGVSIDSRTIKKGDLFIAIKGDNFDGHKFVKDAFKNGASAAIISKNVTGIKDDMPVLKVKNTQNALEKLAVAARLRSQAKIIAVTGSVGKTGVKNALFTLLDKQGKAHCTEGNLNNDIGLPLSLARMREETDYGIFEIGISQKGEMTELGQLLRPNVVVITAIENAHTEFLGSILDVADEKAQIFNAIEENGTVILPFDSSLYPRLFKHAQDAKITDIRNFGVAENAQYRLLHGSEFRNGMKIDVDCNGVNTWYKMDFLGRHNALNSVAVMAAIDAVGGNIRKSAKNYVRVNLADGRGDSCRTEIADCKVTVINDSYNACPASMKSAFVALSSVGFNSKGRLVAVLGDMLELGDKSQEMHASLLDSIVENDISAVYSTGQFMMHLSKALPDDIEREHTENIDKLEEVILNNIQPNDVILFKGSNGSNIWQLFDRLTNIVDKEAAA